MPEEIDVKSVLNSMVERVVTRFHPEQIILFGSYARGETTRDSDLDLLVVMKVHGSRRQTANEIDMLLSDRTVPLDLIVLTPEELDRQKALPGTIAHEATREGVLIYERPA
ncbi:MAG TPA: nucleotidyltransferase domain-containing protein [Firmicutes bacterium]|nr:nucleotidyltransferase domain-containing protein [Bacillota bacterium]